jgi:predicted glycoside hydrolase/deacetylase ChbG (UPF0249 family)
MRCIFFLLFVLLAQSSFSQETYAEKLGYPKGAKVLILHVDDVGMSWDSNQGAILATEKGVATSMSVMMPCPWVPGFVRYLKDHPKTDAGLHLTLTSEWKDYRWAPVSGKSVTPGLMDNEGALWPSIAEVISHAKPDEVEAEIRAQIEKAKAMGFNPTHLDSHMGTLFSSPDFLQRYIKVGIEYQIPVMFPGGHDTMVGKLMNAETKMQLAGVGKSIWDAGLPVLDDLHNVSYDWKYPADKNLSDADIQKFATAKYVETIKELQPGLTMVIMHCTRPSEVFPFITDSGKTRKGDLLAMQDPILKKFLTDEKYILTTWREVMERRQKVK